MKNEQIRNTLEEILLKADDCDYSKLPPKLITEINQWQWGSYGWTSPTSLLVTAAWRKYLYPDVDCCKIWARDEKKAPIPGGYSIRSADEGVTIPLLAKYDLCTNFCSPNSGMQGSRAIEKMRTEKRLNTNFASTQATVFDLKLFAIIMNEINKLTADEALEVFKLFLTKAKELKEDRIKTNAVLESGTSYGFDLLEFLSTTPDPELTKCVVAACFDVISENRGLKLSGVEDYKTAADARASKPADLSLEKDGRTIVAIEVKDKSQKLDWNNIDRAKKIISRYNGLVSFIFVLENRMATITKTIQDMLQSDEFENGQASKIIFMSLHDLYLLALLFSQQEEIANRTGKFLALAPAVKPQTRKKWLATL